MKEIYYLKRTYFVTLFLCFTLLSKSNSIYFGSRFCIALKEKRFFTGIKSGIIKFNSTNNQPVLKGRVMDEEGIPQEFAIVSLLRLPDSTFVEGVTTDTAGKFKLQAKIPGKYIVKVMALGLSTYFSGPIELKEGDIIEIPPIVLKVSVATLQTVNIMGVQTPVERKGNMYVVKVENSVKASGTTIDLLKSTPFVSASSEDVKLQGKKTMVMVDNNQIPDASVQDILKMIPASSIISMELITNPSAKYDATYGAVINIITKKKQLEGYTANLRTEAAQGQFGQQSINADITFKKKKFNFFLMGAYTKNDQMTFNYTDRRITNNMGTKVINDNLTRMFYQNFFSLQSRLEYKLKENQTIGAQITSNNNRSHGNFNSSDLFSNFAQPIDSILYTDSPFKNKSGTNNFNVNYLFTADSGRKELSVLSTFTPYQTDFYQYFSSSIKDESGNVIRIPTVYQTNNNANVNIWITQADYNFTAKNNLKWEMGLKNQNTNSVSSIRYEEKLTDQFIQVPDFSNKNKLKENIAAAYLILGKEFGKDRIQLGLRSEYTIADFTGTAYQNYFKIFPTLNFEHSFNDKYNLSLAYKKTINRVPYNELVPYTIFVNRFTAFEGNPLLKPQYDNTLTLNTNLNQLNLSFTFVSINGMFGQFPSQQNFNNGATYIALQNLNNSIDFYIDAFYQLNITNWWKTLNSGSVFGYSKSTGKVLGNTYDLSSYWYNLKTDHIFTISKNIKMELTAYYSSNLTSELTSLGYVGNFDASLMINVLKNKGHIRLGVVDAIKRNVYRSEQNFSAYYSNKYRYSDSRRISLGFTYNFGEMKIVSPEKKLNNSDAIDRLNN